MKKSNPWNDILLSLYLGIGGLGLFLLAIRILSFFQFGADQLYMSTVQWFDFLFLLPAFIFRYGQIDLPVPKVWPYFSAVPAAYLAARIMTLLTLPYELAVIIFSTGFAGATIFIVGLYLQRSKKPKALLKQKLPEIDPGPYPIYLDEDKKFFIPTGTIDYHVQITGGTGTGKTWRVIKPMARQDIIVNKIGVLIYDVKSNMIDDIVYYCKISNRLADLKYFDLERPEWSMTWNPLAYGTADEIANRVFCALYFDSDKASEYYSELASAFLNNLITLLKLEQPIITFIDLYLATSELDTFRTINGLCTRHKTTLQAGYFYQNWLSSPKKERHERLSGLINKLQRFCNREWSPLINSREPEIDLSKIFKNNNILHFGISSQRYPDDAKSISIMMMMEISQQIAYRYSHKPDKPFRIYLDEFYNMVYPQFVNTINKARDAKVDLILAHQSLADLTMVSDDFAEQVSINTRTKIILTQDNSSSAEFFAQLLGTEEVQTQTHSYDTSQLFTMPAGMTIKDEHKFRVNPNTLKELKLGEAIIRTVFPEIGLVVRKIKFLIPEDLPSGFSFKTYLPVLNNQLKHQDSVFSNTNQDLLAIRDNKAPEGQSEEERLKKLQTDLIKEQRRIIPPKIDKDAKKPDDPDKKKDENPPEDKKPQA